MNERARQTGATDPPLGSTLLSDSGLREAQKANPKMAEAFRLLLEAWRYAREVDRDAWDFAVELFVLRRAGLTRSDVRLLVCKGFVCHASELPDTNDGHRRFQPEASLSIGRNSCFILTPAGINLLSGIEESLPAGREGSVSLGTMSPPVREVASALPVFLNDVRELRFLERVVKRFKHPSPNQEAVLLAFEEDGWPRRIDDPLPPHPDCPPKKRLLDTIKSLNRHQRSPLLHFSGDGTGEGICWEPLSTQGQHPRR